MEKGNNASLKDALIMHIQGKILSGELKPGDKLLPERQLAEEMGLSRGSVNQALLDLERMGFLKIIPRKGSFVADYMSATSPELLAAIMNYDSALVDPKLFRDLMAMRILIERESVRLACVRAKTLEIRELNSRLNRIYSAGHEDIGSAIYEFHFFLTVMSGNKAFALLFRSFKTLVCRLIELHYSRPDEIKRMIPKYTALCTAISLGNTEEADAYIMETLKAGEEQLNKVLSRER